MPYPKAEKRITERLTTYLERAARTRGAALTHSALIVEAGCARATFYKYAREGTALRSAIDEACAAQARIAPRSPEEQARDEERRTIATLRARIGELETALRGATLRYAALIDALRDAEGIPAASLQRAQRATLSPADGRGTRRAVAGT